MSHVGPPPWLEELALRPGPPWLHMGLRTIDEADWLDIDERRTDELARKHGLLASRRDDVFAALEGTDAACREALDLIVGHLTRHHAEIDATPDPGVHPLEAAGLLVQDDLCLMVEHDGVSQLAAASLCFPSHWRLADKIGGSAAAIHAPVPHYASELSTRVDRFLARIPDGRIALRRNWGVHDHDALFAPSHPTPAPGVTAGSAGERLWLRSERQTLRRLPRSGAVLFTIRVQQAPLAVMGARPDLAHAMATTARAAADAGHQRVTGGHLDAAATWLDQV